MGGERNHISSSTETGVFIGILYQGRVTKSRSKMWLMGKRRRGEPQKKSSLPHKRYKDDHIHEEI